MKPQKWGASTHNGSTVYLHILDASEAKDGWLTLTGTGDVQLNDLRAFPAAGTVESPRNDAGELEVKLPEDADDVDIILSGSTG